MSNFFSSLNKHRDSMISWAANPSREKSTQFTDRQSVLYAHKLSTALSAHRSTAPTASRRHLRRGSTFSHSGNINFDIGFPFFLVSRLSVFLCIYHTLLLLCMLPRSYCVELPSIGRCSLRFMKRTQLKVL